MKTLANKLFLTILLAAASWALAAQVEGVSIATGAVPPDPSAMLDVQSSNKGLLIPRVQLTALNNPSPVLSPAVGLMVYNPGPAAPAGYYYWDGGQWRQMGGDNDWDTDGTSIFRNPGAGFVAIGDNPSRYAVEFPATDPIYTGEKNGTIVLRSQESFDNSDPNQWRYIVIGADGNEINCLNPTKNGTGLYLNYNSCGLVRIGGYDPSSLTRLEVQGAISAGTAVSCSSDKRLKKDIRPLGDALDILRQLEPVSFQWRFQDSEDRHYGLIAQEVQRVATLQSLVSENVPDRTKAPEAKSYLELNYTELIPFLIKGIKEQQASMEQIQEFIKEQQDTIEKQQEEIRNMAETLQQLQQDVQNLKRFHIAPAPGKKPN